MTTELMAVGAALSGAALGFVGALVAPLLSERMRRTSTRVELLLTQRILLYADLLEVAATLVDNASTWAALPNAELTERSDEELNRVVARLRVLASKKVREEFAAFKTFTHTFNRLHGDDVRRVNVTTPPPPRFVGAISDAVDGMRASYARLEALIHQDLGV